MLTGVLLKETVEDLEWPSGGSTVEAFLRRDPPLITFSASGLGDLKVTLPVRVPLRRQMNTCPYFKKHCLCSESSACRVFVSGIRDRP